MEGKGKRVNERVNEREKEREREREGERQLYCVFRLLLESKLAEVQEYLL